VNLRGGGAGARKGATMPAMSAPRLVPFTPRLAAAHQQGALAEALGIDRLPADWPTFPEGVAPDCAAEPPPDGAHWGPWLYLRADGGALLGNGGFTGAPQQGVVELGYEIAPEHRGQGHAQAAVRAMLALAWAQAEVCSVLAHTLAEHNPSTGVLSACGFAFDGEQPNDELGCVWRWRLDRP
jgi:ribosomal-protein-alanine N-acetyltransferase